MKKNDDLGLVPMIMLFGGIAFIFYVLYLLTTNWVVPLVEINSTMNHIEKTLKK